MVVMGRAHHLSDFAHVGLGDKQTNLLNSNCLCEIYVSDAMFALGHKQTCAVQEPMSALPPKADICSALADVRFTPNSYVDCVFRHVCCGPIADIQSAFFGFQTNAAVRGRITLISVNSPGCVSTSIEPACCFTMMS